MQATEPERITVSLDELRRLTHENQHLRDQVTELQQRMTAMVEERRAQDITCQVSEFHRAFDYPVRTKPQQPSREELGLRLRLLAEEFFEVLEACLAQNPASSYEVKQAKAFVAEAVRIKLHPSYMYDPIDLPALADGLADLDYVSEGFRLTCGIPRVPVAAEVQRSNMRKVGGPVVAGKKLKPPGWQPPDIAGVLRDHGWES